MRNAGLDILRFIAVLLVIGRHMAMLKDSPLRFWRTGGWIGVDLFFVLSGFLISGLLFKEYKIRSSLDIKRFLIRRAFKIYPPFWLLLISTVLVSIFLGHQTPPKRAMLSELFFVQNYFGGLWNHTWSLAVEEHFYFGLAGLFWIVMVWRRCSDFRWIPWAFLGVAGACLALRLIGWQLHPTYSHGPHLFRTHIRIDSLFYGVLLSYFYNFAPNRLVFFAWPTALLLGMGFLLLAPAFVFPLEEYWFVSALGVILFYLGSGFLVVAAMRLTTVRSAFARLCAALGAASYSIYLWHIPVNTWGWGSIQRLTGSESFLLQGAVSIVGACAVGYVASRLIECPVLFLRNRLFPSRSEPQGTAKA
jgi:peptidoglycan/LPS O-acetylase OafA/YrhL